MNFWMALTTIVCVISILVFIFFILSGNSVTDIINAWKQKNQ